jgi:hypothetical protein
MTMVAERLCEHCGGTIPPGKRADARYCGDLCRNAANRASRSDPIRSAAPARQAPGKQAVDPAARVEPASWEPATGPRQAYQTDDACPDCGAMLLAGPRGTWRVCGSCRRPVVLAAVSRPYERGQQRQVVSQREKDLAALALARRKGMMLAQLATLAADERLHPESQPAVEWYSAEVRAATSESRLDELAELADGPDSGIRRRRWWQGRPAPIGAPDWPEDDDDDDDQGDDDDRPAAPAPLAIEAAPAPSPALTWAAALDACGWRLSPVIGGCSVIDERGHCGAQPNTHHVVGRNETHAWLCDQHFGHIVRVISISRGPT